MFEWINKPPPGVPINWSHPLTRDLKLALLFNEGAGGIVNNLVPNGYTGRLTGFSFPGIPTSGWIPGKDGWGLATDDVNDWVDLGNILNMGTSSFTVFVRFIATSWLTTATSSGRLIQKRGTGGLGDNAGWCFGFYRVGTHVRFANSFIDDTANWATISASDIVFVGYVGDIINLVIVVDREGGEWRTYLGKRLRITKDISAIAGSLDNTRKLTLGGSDVAATQYGGYKYLAVMLWQRTLNLDEVRQVTANPYRIISTFDMALLAPLVAGMPMPLLMQTMDHFDGGAVL